MLRRALVILIMVGGSPACGDAGPPASGDLDSGPTEVRRRPGLNVLLITIDTLRADALGAYGNEQAATPWMDRLAAAGVRFSSARAHGVVTLPTHASLLSGLLPQEHGVRDNSGFRFPGDKVTLAEILRREGYATGAFVSAFPLDSRFGLDRGFDIYEDSFVGTSRRPAFFEQERAGETTVTLARNWIDQQGGNPWFCWVHLYEPHFPYDPPEPLLTQFRNDLYLGDVAAADLALAPLLEPILNEVGETGTLVVLTSDHGEALGEHGEATHGIFAYESVLRVPLILHQPEVFEPRVVDSPVRHIDVLPTILDALGIEPEEKADGRSLLAEAQGGTLDVSAVTYFESLSPQLNRGWAPLYGLVDGDLKYIELPIPELYDLSADPGEKANLAPAEPDQVEAMRTTLAALRETDPGNAPGPEDAETIERLRSLGYVTGSARLRQDYDEGDDPKHLIQLDTAMREVVTLYSMGELPRALERAKELVRTRPGMRMALLQLAHLERESGNLDAAIEALREAYALYPADSTTLAMLGAYLTQAGRPEEAVRFTESHVQLAEPDVDVLLVHALALARSGQATAAFDVLDKARGMTPENPMVLVHMGTLWLMSGARDQARGAFEESLSLHPDVAAAHTALGVMAIEEDRVEAGVAHWRQAVSADPEQITRLLAMGMSLWNRGQISMAVPLLELFAELAPSEAYREEILHVRSLLENAG